MRAAAAAGALSRTYAYSLKRACASLLGRTRAYSGYSGYSGVLGRTRGAQVLALDENPFDALPEAVAAMDKLAELTLAEVGVPAHTPQSTAEYPRVPQSTPEYPRVPQSTPLRGR